MRFDNESKSIAHSLHPNCDFITKQLKVLGNQFNIRTF